MLSGFPGSRQLILPNLALSALVAVLIRFCLARRDFGMKAVGARLPRYDGVAHVTGRTIASI